MMSRDCSSQLISFSPSNQSINQFAVNFQRTAAAAAAVRQGIGIGIGIGARNSQSNEHQQQQVGSLLSQCLLSLDLLCI